MLHLDEGILSALLDGELSGTEQRDVEAHLRGCAECRERLAEMQGFLREADQLVTALDAEPLTPAPTKPAVRRRPNYRVLAWAASVVLAVGLGFMGQSILRNRSMNFSVTPAQQDEGGQLEQSPAPPAPAAEAPAATTREPVATGTTGSDQRLGGVRQEPSAAGEVASDLERRTAKADSLMTDSIGLRSQIAGNQSGPPNRTLSDAAAGAGISALAESSRRDSSPAEEVKLRAEATAELDVAAVRDPGEAQKQNAQPQTAPTFQVRPRDEVGNLAPVRKTGSRVIPMEEAVRLLGGSIRLVDSITPLRVEQVGADSTIRVVYLTAGAEIWLDQRRERGIVSPEQSLPTAMYRRQLAGTNQLSWHDLQGFYLTLTGPLPSAILEQLKARIR